MEVRNNFNNFLNVTQILLYNLFFKYNKTTHFSKDSEKKILLIIIIRIVHL